MRLLRGREGRRLHDHRGEREAFLSRSISYESGWRSSPQAPLKDAIRGQQRQALPISEAIGGFSRVYAAAVLDYMRALPEDALESVVRALSRAISANGSTVYIFGNGGSHAIARHLEYALRMRFRALYGIRIKCGVDYHSAQAHAVGGGYGSIFEVVLRTDLIAGHARPAAGGGLETWSRLKQDGLYRHEVFRYHDHAWRIDTDESVPADQLPAEDKSFLELGP